MDYDIEKLKHMKPNAASVKQYGKEMPWKNLCT